MKWMMIITKEQLSELRRLAEQVATWGNWEEVGPLCGEECDPPNRTRVLVDNPDSEVNGATICMAGLDMGENMEYIAAFNPVTAVALLDRIAELEKEAATKAKFSLTTADMMTRYIHAMQAAVVASRTRGARAGMFWIENTLCGPGHLPDPKETNAQEFFNQKIKELEEFRAKCNAEQSAQFNASAAESAHGSRSNKPASSGLYFWGIKMYISVYVDPDDVLQEVSNEDLLKECERRKLEFVVSTIPADLEAIAMEISIGNHPRAIDLTKQYIWESCGRIVN